MVDQFCVVRTDVKYRTIRRERPCDFDRERTDREFMEASDHAKYCTKYALNVEADRA